MAPERYFDAEKHDGSIPPVGLADIEKDEWDSLPAHVQATVDSLPYFRKTKPTQAPPSRRVASTDDPKET